MKPQLLIGAATSGSGKTTFTMGLLRALHKRGLRVQPFKCGPDYIDTQFHTLAADHESVNLDTWMASNTHVQHLYNKYGDGADVCVTEGVMGLFDGYQRMQGSSAEIARLLNIPVVLIVSARSTAYSVAPLIYGFKHFNPAVKIAGIVFNQVSSPSHFAYLREACVDAGVECLGYLPMTEGLKIPSRHLGLTLTAKRSMNTLIEQAAELNGYIISYYDKIANFTGTMPEIGFFDPMKARLPMLIFSVLYCAFVMPKFCPEAPSVATAESSQKETAARKPLPAFAEVAGIVIFFGVAIALMLQANVLKMVQIWQICIIGAVLMIIFGVLKPREALQSIPVSMLLLIVGALAMAGALSATGTGDFIGGGIAKIVTAVNNNYIVGLIFLCFFYLLFPLS